MNASQHQTILSMLKNCLRSPDLKLKISRNYNDLKTNTLKLECIQEIRALHDMLKDRGTFEAQFKERCRLRQNNSDRTIPLAVLPNSVTNRLYRKIATILFDPKTMQEMLGIILPSVKSHLKISLKLPERVNSLKENTKLEPILELSDSLKDLTEVESTERWSKCVFSENTVLELADIEHFSLPIHVQLHQLLLERYPRLAKKVYSHNSHLQTLESDIQTVKNKGILSKTALENLIQSLILGGQRMTGSVHASQSAIEAAGRFSEYLNTLPTDFQERLRQLKGTDITLGEVIDNELAAGKCVETASEHLINILDNNRQNSILITPTHMTVHDLNKLENKYKPIKGMKGIQLIKEDDAYELPAKLAELAIKSIVPSGTEDFSTDDLISILINFPSTLYDVLWAHLPVNKPEDQLRKLANIIAADILTLEQRQALAKAIAKSYPRFKLEKPFLFWAVDTNDPIFLQEALNFYPEEQERLKAIKVFYRTNQSLLQRAANNPAFLFTLLSIYDTSERLEAVSRIDENGQTLLHKVIANPESIKTILSLLPSEKRLAAVKLMDEEGNSVLHKATTNVETLKVLLTWVPEVAKLNLFKLTNKYHVSILQEAAARPDSLEILLLLYPQIQRLKIIRTPNKIKLPLLSFAAGNPECLKKILILLPDNQRLEFLKINIEHESILDRFIKHQIEVSSNEEAFKNSFVADFINIITFLTKQSELEKLNHTSDYKVSLLIAELKQFNSFDEIKNHLKEFIISNTDIPLNVSLIKLGHFTFEDNKHKKHPRSQVDENIVDMEVDEPSFKVAAMES